MRILLTWIIFWSSLFSSSILLAKEFDFLGKSLVNRKSTGKKSEIKEEIRLNCMRRDFFNNTCVEIELVEIKTVKKSGEKMITHFPEPRFSVTTVDQAQQDLRSRVRRDSTVIIPGLTTYALVRATHAWWVYLLSPVILAIDIAGSVVYDLYAIPNAWRPMLKRKIRKLIESAVKNERGDIKVSQNNYRKIRKVITVVY